MVAVCVFDEGYCSFLEVFFFPWTEGHLVTKVHHERVHAVSFHGDVHGLALRDQLSDLFHQYGFLYQYRLGHILCCSPSRGGIFAKVLIIFAIFERLWKILTNM